MIVYCFLFDSYSASSLDVGVVPALIQHYFVHFSALQLLCMFRLDGYFAANLKCKDMINHYRRCHCLTACCKKTSDPLSLLASSQMSRLSLPICVLILSYSLSSVALSSPSQMMDIDLLDISGPVRCDSEASMHLASSSVLICRYRLISLVRFCTQITFVVEAFLAL